MKIKPAIALILMISLLPIKAADSTSPRVIGTATAKVMVAKLLKSPHPFVVTSSGWEDTGIPPHTNHLGIEIVFSGKDEAVALAEQIQNICYAGKFKATLIRQDLTTTNQFGVSVICPPDFNNTNMLNALELMFAAIGQKPNINMATNWLEPDIFKSRFERVIIRQPMTIKIGIKP